MRHEEISGKTIDARHNLRKLKNRLWGAAVALVLCKNAAPIKSGANSFLNSYSAWSISLS